MSHDARNLRTHLTYWPVSKPTQIGQNMMTGTWFFGSFAKRGQSSADKMRSLSSSSKIKSFFNSNWLVIGEIVVILAAKRWPNFFASGGPCMPEFWISKVGVCTIFFLNGIALSMTGDASQVRSAAKTNALIQCFNLMAMPLMAFLTVRFYPDASFRDGLLVLACLPQTINISVAQTMAAGGDMGTAIFNAICGNLIGVFLTPLLTVALLGASKGVSLLGTLKKLGLLVIAPMGLGQLARKTPLLDVAEKFNKASRNLCSVLLLAIVYNTFSDTFKKGIGITGMSLFGLIGFMPVLYLANSAIFWGILGKLIPGLDARTKTAAVLCSSQKTLAFGVPFIKCALGHRPDLANILAPLLLYAPAELLLGSTLLVPLLKNMIEQEDSFEDGEGI
jgi:sodium/bile acid cotransporter 7